MAQDRPITRIRQTLALTALFALANPCASGPFGAPLPGFDGQARAAARPAPGRKPVADAVPASPLDAAGWRPDNEWLISGNYAEVGSEPGVSLAFLGVPPCDGDSRKVLVFQFANTSHYKAIDLGGLSAVLVAQAPAGEPLTLANRARWRRADLLVSDQVDSLKALALHRALDLTFADAVGTMPLRLERVPVGVGMSRERVIVTCVDRINVILRPLSGGNPMNPPQIQNQAAPFPFLGYLNLGRADTLYYAAAPPSSERWSFGGTAGLTTTFGWSSERAAETRQ